MKKITVRQLTICAALIALHIVLEFVSIRIGNDYKITFSGLPIMIAGVIYRAPGGLAVGLIGSVLSQLITFGITPTTVLWIIPPAVMGLVMGLLYKVYGYKPGFTARRQVNASKANGSAERPEKAGKTFLSGIISPLTVCVFITLLINTILNLTATYFDSKVWGYYWDGYIIALIPIRLVNWAMTSVVCSIVICVVVSALKKRFPDIFQVNNKHYRQEG